MDMHRSTLVYIWASGFRAGVVCPLFVSLKGGVPLSSLKLECLLLMPLLAQVWVALLDRNFPARPGPVAARGSGGLGYDGGRMPPLNVGGVRR